MKTPLITFMHARVYNDAKSIRKMKLKTCKTFKEQGLFLTTNKENKHSLHVGAL